MSKLDIRLTETVKKGGCAAKLPAGQLRQVLRELKLKRPPELRVGLDTLDDACLWDLGDGRLLVQTLDFFTPIVDHPEDFGAIAACNAISDVYAMGGKPATALTILGFPAGELPLEILGRMLAGAVEVIHQSGACLAGGHTIDDDTIKLGFSVTGFVDQKRAWTNAGGKPGDVLLLTKGLGTGTITTALKLREARPEWVAAATESMKTLNNAIDFLDGINVHAATDITGFGLAGHALQLAQASKVNLRIDTTLLPVLPGALECLGEEMGMLNRAHHSNAEYALSHTQYRQSVSSVLRWITLDPQTSGGLLLVVSKDQAQAALERLTHQFPMTRQIGTVTESSENGPRLEFI